MRVTLCGHEALERPRDVPSRSHRRQPPIEQPTVFCSTVTVEQLAALYAIGLPKVPFTGEGAPADHPHRGRPGRR